MLNKELAITFIIISLLVVGWGTASIIPNQKEQKGVYITNIKTFNPFTY